MNADSMIIDAREDERAWTMRVYLNDEDVTDATYRAMIASKPSIEIEGWVERYILVDGVVQIDRKTGRVPEYPRTHGLVRWEYKK